MSSRAARITVVAVSLALVAVLVTGFATLSGTRTTAGFRELTRPEPAAAFDLPVLDPGPGVPPSLPLAALRGRFVVVNFWASWCEPCREEMPALQRLFADYRSRGLVVLGVNIRGDAVSDARAFEREIGVTYPSVVDRTAATARAYGVTGQPYTFVIDPEGRVVGAQAGPVDVARLRELFTRLLGPPRP